MRVLGVSIIAIRQCVNGHLYDEKRGDVCPYCGAKYIPKVPEDIPERFRNMGRISPLRKGPAGRVFKISGEKDYTLKIIECGADEKKYKEALHELRIMDALKNVKSAVSAVDSECVDRPGIKTVYILEEYYTPLSEYILGRTVISVGDALTIAVGLCGALTECKRAGVMHLDVQPNNIYIDGSGSVKLGNFGSAVFIGSEFDKDALIGTLSFMAPEAYRERHYSEQSNVYSAGLVIYALFNGGKLPFMDSENERTAIYKRLAGTPFPRTRSGGKIIKELIDEACAYDPGNRIGSFEFLGEKLTQTLNRCDSGGISKEILFPETMLSGERKAASAPYPVSFGSGSTASTVPLTAPFDIADYGSGRDKSDHTVSDPLPSDADRSDDLNIKKVQFSAIAPKRFTKGDYTVINIVMYEDSFRGIVDELKAEADTEVSETRSGVAKVRDGSNIKISLTSPDIEIEDNEDERLWQGDYLNFTFAVMLPEQYRKRQVLFCARVYINDVIAAKLTFTAKCFSMREQKISVTREDILSAFISYARQDRARVAAIIQGMKKIRPDMDIFFDVESLRSGADWKKSLYEEIESRDIFFLCWSHFAQQSDWVGEEWRYALSCKGIDCIEPIPIEPPDVCPPPEELKKKHFNDRLLYIINS